MCAEGVQPLTMLRFTFDHPRLRLQPIMGLGSNIRLDSGCPCVFALEILRRQKYHRSRCLRKVFLLLLRFTFAIWRAWANNGSNIRLDSESGGETSAAHHKQAGCSNTYSICWTSFLSPSPQLPPLSRQAVAGEGEEGVERWKGRGRSCIRVNVGGEAANLESSPQLLWASGSFSAEKVKATECLSGCLVGGILK